MAALTLYGNNGALGPGYNTLSLSDATYLNLAQGWTVGTTAAGNYSVLQGNTIRAAGTFDGTAPTTFSQYGYRTDWPISGSFANTDWSALLSARSGPTYYDMQGKVGFRLWRSANANGSGATQITNGWNMCADAIEFTAINQVVTKTVTWSPGGVVTLTNEYLWQEILWEITTAAANAAAIVYFPEQAAANLALTTPDFTAASAGGGGRIVPKRYGMGGLI